jgi:hypothetical protein
MVLVFVKSCNSKKDLLLENKKKYTAHVTKQN